jgi:hypothetical protein
MTDWVIPSPQVKRIQQRTEATCWLAACQMLFRWKRKSVLEVEKLLRKSTDDRVDFDYWCESGIGTEDLVPLAKALGLNFGGGGTVSASLLAQTVEKCGPILIVGEWSSSSHVVVLAEIEEGESSDSALIRIANPWFGCDEREERNMYWLNKGMGQWKSVNGQYIHW